MNQVNISGRLGNTPELKQTTGGHQVTTFSVAVYNGKDKDSIWVPVVAFNKVAEFIATYLQKGDPVEIAGKMRENKYTDRDGNTRSRLEVEARDASFPPSSHRQDGAGTTNSAGVVSMYPRSEKYATGQNEVKPSYPVTLGTPSDAYAGFEDADGDVRPF
jgi:single-strand DNA-binding protein